MAAGQPGPQWKTTCSLPASPVGQETWSRGKEERDIQGEGIAGAERKESTQATGEGRELHEGGPEVKQLQGEVLRTKEGERLA